MRKLIEGADYFVYLVDFPVCTSGGAVTPNDDGTYTVLLNARLTHEKNMESCRHERRHMKRGDLWREESAAQIERDAG